MDKLGNKIYTITHGTSVDRFKDIMKSGELKPIKRISTALKATVNYFSISMKSNYKNLKSIVKNDPNVKHRIDEGVILFFDDNLIKNFNYYINVPAVMGLISTNTYISPKLKILLEDDSKLQKFKREIKKINRIIKVDTQNVGKITINKIIKLLEINKDVWNEICIIEKVPLQKYLKFILISKNTYNKNKKFFDEIKKIYYVCVI
jgi:hypothetical protein